MLKSLNYTNRVEIPRQLIYAKLENGTEGWQVSISYDFSSLSEASECEVVMDMFVPGTTESRRINLLGLVGSSEQNTFNLSEMSNPADIRLRFKIVGLSDGPRIIRAQIDDLLPLLDESEEDARSLLPIKPGKGMISPWELKIVKGIPILYISDRDKLFDILRSKVRAPWFYPLIMHNVFKEIFEWLAFSDANENEEMATKWKNVFIDKYDCPEDFFVNLNDMDEQEKSLEVKERSSLISAQVSRKMQHVEKLLLSVTEVGD